MNLREKKQTKIYVKLMKKISFCYEHFVDVEYV